MQKTTVKIFNNFFYKLQRLSKIWNFSPDCSVSVSQIIWERK